MENVALFDTTLVGVTDSVDDSLLLDVALTTVTALVDLVYVNILDVVVVKVTALVDVTDLVPITIPMDVADGGS